MKWEHRLDAESIERASEGAFEFLMGAGMRVRDAHTGKDAIERALNLFLDRLGVGTPMRVMVNKLFGKRRLVIMVRGKKVKPSELERVLYDLDGSIGRTAFASSGLKPTFSYLGGYNIIMITRPYPPLSSLMRIIIAAVAGFVVAGGSSLLLPHEATDWALEAIVKPLFNLYLAMLSGIAGPLIFLSVASSVCGIGDVATLGKSGGRLAKRFLGENLLATLIAVGVCIPSSVCPRLPRRAAPTLSAPSPR